MKDALRDLFTPLSEEEMDRLDRFLLERIDEEADDEGKDEGMLDISELDGFFTAIVSGPRLVPLSQWLPAVWGDFEPVWENEKDFEQIFSLMMRHMNGISTTLSEQPKAFEPIFMEREVKGKTYTIVDEWCEGYMRGVALMADLWDEEGPEIEELLMPILAFTSATNWRAHELGDEEVPIIQLAVTVNARDIYAYWLARRDEFGPGTGFNPRTVIKTGRNDPCFCGSGRKYKKCCLI